MCVSLESQYGMWRETAEEHLQEQGIVWAGDSPAYREVPKRSLILYEHCVRYRVTGHCVRDGLRLGHRLLSAGLSREGINI